MAPLTPHWQRPSHPSIQTVIEPSTTEGKESFFTKSISKIALPPFALFAKLSFPPCTIAEEGATYATVQFGRNTHVNLNSDLVYINHSCDPSLMFDPTTRSIYANHRGLKVGEELTFFYPSTEWDMAQSFDCFCGASTCKGRISGAKNMSAKQLEGQWLSPWVRELLEERDGVPAYALGVGIEGGMKVNGEGGKGQSNGYGYSNGSLENGHAKKPSAVKGGPERGGPTSRELSGEMGGDTSSSA